jgi:hypothetical protein
MRCSIPQEREAPAVPPENFVRIMAQRFTHFSFNAFPGRVFAVQNSNRGDAMDVAGLILGLLRAVLLRRAAHRRWTITLTTPIAASPLGFCEAVSEPIWRRQARCISPCGTTRSEFSVGTGRGSCDPAMRDKDPELKCVYAGGREALQCGCTARQRRRAEPNGKRRWKAI